MQDNIEHYPRCKNIVQIVTVVPGCLLVIDFNIGPFQLAGLGVPHSTVGAYQNPVSGDLADSVFLQLVLLPANAGARSV